MSKNALIIVGFLAISIVAAGAIFLNREPVPPQVPSDCSDLTNQTAVTIVYTTDTFFSPSCVKVSSNTTFTWENASDTTIEIGADPHPIHTGNQEVSAGEFVLEIKAGNKAQVTLQELGIFGYHDHLNSSATGIIVVE